MFAALARLFYGEDRLREAARKLWDGHDFEFDQHWRFGKNYKVSNPRMYRLTIYPKLERDAAVALLFRHQ